MNYAKIKDCDIANGPGTRVSLFVSGCRNHCKGCFQPETWDFEYGEPFTRDVWLRILNILDRDYIAGLSILGGEPMEPENQVEILPLAKSVKDEYPEKNIWIFTGYNFEQLMERSCEEGKITRELLSYIDVLVDGPFILEQKDISLRFRGSGNQRILDMEKSRESDWEPIPWRD